MVLPLCNDFLNIQSSNWSRSQSRGMHVEILKQKFPVLASVLFSSVNVSKYAFITWQTYCSAVCKQVLFRRTRLVPCVTTDSFLNSPFFGFHLSFSFLWWKYTKFQLCHLGYLEVVVSLLLGQSISSFLQVHE